MKQIKVIIDITAILLLFFLLGFSSSSSAAICINSNCSYLSIQNAIDAAVNGDTILVSDGVYSETLNYASKIITIQSQNGAASATIQGDGSNAPVITFASSALNVSTALDGFTIDNQSNGQFFTQGILISNGAAPTLRNLLIKGNSVSEGYSGGGIKIDGGGVSIHDSTIGGSLANKNSAAKGGGIYAVNSSLPITITNSNFSYNNANDLGGAIYLTNVSSTLTITGSVLSDNTGRNRGGAIYSDMAAISITNTSMVRNVTVMVEGAAIYYVGSASSITVSDSILTDNTAATSSGGGRGGAIYSVGAVLNISNTNLDRNSGSDAGAAIYISGVSAMNTITNSTLNNNSARNRGSAIYSNGTPLSITDTAIDGNTTSNEGGALYLVNSGAAVAITGGTLSNNSGAHGGAIYMTGGAESLSITGTTLSGNTCLYHGGAIYLDSLLATSTITDSTINNSTGSHRGGAIYNANSLLTIVDTDMDNHSSAYEGGAVYIKGLAATTTITGGSISNNIVNSSGGALYVGDGANVAITGATINSNTANLYNGGAMFVQGTGTTVNLSKTIISGNETHQRGGAIVVGSSTVVTLTNCIVTGNVADGERWSEGGGIMNYGTVNIYNSTFAGNYVWGPWGGGGGLRNSGTATIKNSIFWGNRAVRGSQIRGTTTVTYSDIEDGYSGTGNIDQDPLFVNSQRASRNKPTAAGDFHIQAGSPILDQGTSIGAPADDIDDDRRPMGGGIDMGADECCGSLLPSPSYFLINHDGFGIHCVGEVISVRPKQSDGSDLTGYTGTVVLDTQSGKGSWIATNGNGTLTDVTANDGKATYTFSGTETLPVTFTLEYREGASTINVDVYDNTLRDNDAEGDIVFSPNGFTVSAAPLNLSEFNSTIPVQIAGNSFPLYITAYGETPTDTVCGIIESYTGAEPKPLKFWSDYNDPIAGTRQVTVDRVAVASFENDAIGQDVLFTNGQAQVTTKYKDVGRITLSMKDDNVDDPELPTGIQGATNPFVLIPADFVLSITANLTTEGDCSTSSSFELLPPLDHTNNKTLIAGDDFCVKVTAVETNGEATPNFGRETTGESVELISTILAPAEVDGGLDPGVTISTDFDFTTGIANGSAEGVFTWAEVGITNLTAHVKEDQNEVSDYLGAGDVTSSVSVPVGRFIPASFSVFPVDPEFRPGCQAGQFTYIGESFNYSSIPRLTLTALNAIGGTTTNYTLPDWDKLAANNATYSPVAELSKTSPDLSQTREDGVITIVFDEANAADLQSFNRAIAPQNDFTAQIALSIDLQDGDNVSIDGGPVDGSKYTYTFGRTAAPNGISFGGIEDPNTAELEAEIPKRVFYGRLKIGINSGSELFDLNIPVTTERYEYDEINDVVIGFVPNVDDVCTGGVGNASDITFLLTDPNGSDALEAVNTCIWESPSIDNESGIACVGVEAIIDRTYAEPPLAAGDLNVWLRAPDNGASGSLNLGANAPPWLKYDWYGIGDENPQGLATFGIFTGNRQHIFLREVY